MLENISEEKTDYQMLDEHQLSSSTSLYHDDNPYALKKENSKTACCTTKVKWLIFGILTVVILVTVAIVLAVVLSPSNSKAAGSVDEGNRKKHITHKKTDPKKKPNNNQHNNHPHSNDNHEKCVCAGVQDTNNQGGSDCYSKTIGNGGFDYKRPYKFRWCYVEEGACSGDMLLSDQIIKIGKAKYQKSKTVCEYANTLEIKVNYSFKPVIGGEQFNQRLDEFKSGLSKALDSKILTNDIHRIDPINKSGQVLTIEWYLNVSGKSYEQVQELEDMIANSNFGNTLCSKVRQIKIGENYKNVTNCDANIKVKPTDYRNKPTN